MVSQIVWLGVKDVFTQIAKDVVGQGLDHGTLTVKGQRALVEIDRPGLLELSVLRWLIVIETILCFRRSLTGFIQNQCRVSCGTIACSDVTEGNETQKPAKFARVIRVKMADSHRKRFYALGRRSLRGLIQNQCGVSCGTIACSDVTEGNETQKPRILMTHPFLERIGQPEVDLANDREESVPFNVLDATFILEFSSSQMFTMLFRDLLGSTETERNALVLEDFL
ncbi:hypothetical protein F2Q70_00003712 [Brassica cretica]|uniref:Uncharacterized protein n=1 Tax=Brassica cretica TaxID=69181 RepID=A0A8S9J2N2_BRACR|nr:hypothetical protein F2Q70_00003712 [Brassica cretica]